MYELPNFEIPKIKIPKKRIFKGLGVILTSCFFGFLAGAVSGSFFYLTTRDYLKVDLPQFEQIEKIIEKERIIEKEYIPQTSQEEKIIKVVKQASPSVVSIIIDKDAGGGTGFIVSSDGMILTNKHVVLDEDAEYTILTNDGDSFSAKVLAIDPFQDLAIIKIENHKKFNALNFGDSNDLQIGQTVIAIGNALGEFQNTISVGVISALDRTITASGGGLTETLEDVIQTDAAINKGNSGGPLLNLKGEVIGINTATVLGAQNIGFAIPVNKAQKDIEQVKTLGRIVYPFLGVRYVPVADNYGVLIIKGDGIDEPAIAPNSAADKAGLKENDIILEFDGEKITPENSLKKIIEKYEPGDKVILKILSGSKEKNVEVVLEERP